MDKRFAVVLAAGQGTRMKSKLYKVLHPVCGKSMVEHVVDEVLKLSLAKLVTIVGHGADDVKNQLGSKSEYALQAEQLGTAHAVKQAKSILANETGTTIVVCGDTPLLTAETMEAMLKEHREQKAKVTILTAMAKNPTGYGRIIRNETGIVEKIVEHKDATKAERLVKEINTGTYCFDNEMLFEAIEQVSNDNVQGEYYLPDVIEILKQKGETVAAYQADNFQETLGVNDRVALSQAETYMKQRINNRHMVNGVSLIDPNNTYISAEAVIGRDTVIYPGTMIKGRVEIGEDSVIGQNSELENSKIGNRTVIKQSVIMNSEIGDDVMIGPFAHIRPDSKIGNEVRIGNFVEVKKTEFGNRSKASHLSYIGDAEIGEDVNLGCGSITVNYDGKHKYLTKVEDGAFVGCNSNLIAPITIGKGAYVAAGSTVTDDVPGAALSIARAKQVNKEDYTKKLHKK
ncbi:bifunctional UDP-N-acetylglucosamine diphosphorylase/glucosamine-1-phosphate N-acetyltransferase GlmU [Bacillus changyiensis]|uniref:bifunctional UDP-N-acetylglucosamine diphosphorylase/glucosamine-1-phosphate N-acetyltransferase GlmU n=1 Tax=Bacillus changyiensis TaxID=3004103 RepID=UPI0022DFE2AE|nr:bifunctional UDP-N-acetylglucosamine diphosphorylase/glucosamine-1-phosphate N-acetyltransferase GlmU [Bacillus changyiensis]MDA1478220.1 bifunctional UDP-N-acetylglucosamine diphosphorylase/glucosamine-1-phosphate N-acetyltransferase GlmU [Bacillus changyiensis]